MSFPVNFRFMSGKISADFFFGKILLHQKIRLWISGGVSSAIFELSCSFSPLSAFKTILTVYCQLVSWLLSSLEVRRGSERCSIWAHSKHIIDNSNSFQESVRPCFDLEIDKKKTGEINHLEDNQHFSCSRIQFRLNLGMINEKFWLI